LNNLDRKILFSHSNGFSNGGAMPPGIMPPSYQNPQSNGGGMISYPPNGPFLMTLAGGPPGGYKTNKKQKILLVEKLMAKDKGFQFELSFF